MAWTINRLKSTTLKTVASGRHSDGGGLYLSVSDSGARSWVFLWRRAAKRREMGLGSLADVSLASARDAAEIARKHLRAGLDPIAERDRALLVPKTFGEAADAMLSENEGAWRNEKHRAQWRMTLTNYAGPIRSIPVAAIDTDHVLRVLRPIWTTKPETASRVRGRIERVLDYAKAHQVGDETERAYRRGDALDRRRELMEAWAAYCANVSNVLTFARA